MGVVYHANYLIWMEMGRVELCRSMGVRYRDMEEQDGVLLTVAEARCRYHAPARYDDEVVVSTKVVRSTSRLIEFEYEMQSAESRQKLATGATVHVFCGRELKPCRLPEKYWNAFGVTAKMTDNMERQGATTFKGNPLTLVGPELKAGEKAPDFEVVDGGLQPVSLNQTGEGVRIFSVLPSLDTPVCDIQTKRFNTEAAQMPNVKIFTISMDLPFAQKRYCDAYAVDNVKMLSDHKSGSFGAAYGTLIKEWRVESRAIFVVDANNTIQHAEYVKEVADHPDYDAALAKAKQLAG